MATDEKRHAKGSRKVQHSHHGLMDNSASATRGIQRECEIVNQHLESSMTESRTATTPPVRSPKDQRPGLICCMHAHASRCAHKVKGVPASDLTLACMLKSPCGQRGLRHMGLH
jgi:hypothetical protein